MSATTFTEAACAGKHAFPSYTAAAKVASLTSRRKDTRCRPYKCNACGLYHFGQSFKPKGKMNER